MSRQPIQEPKDMCETTDDDNELNEDDEVDCSLNESVVCVSLGSKLVYY